MSAFIDTEKSFAIHSNATSGCMGATGPALAYSATGKVFRARPAYDHHPRQCACADYGRGPLRHWPAFLHFRRLDGAECRCGKGRRAVDNACSPHSLTPQTRDIARRVIDFHEVGRLVVTADPSLCGGRFIDAGAASTEGLGGGAHGHAHRRSRRTLAALQVRQQTTGICSPSVSTSISKHGAFGATRALALSIVDSNSYLYTVCAMNSFCLGAEHKRRLAEAFLGTNTPSLPGVLLLCLVVARGAEPSGPS